MKEKKLTCLLLDGINAPQVVDVENTKVAFAKMLDCKKVIIYRRYIEGYEKSFAIIKDLEGESKRRTLPPTVINFDGQGHRINNVEEIYSGKILVCGINTYDELLSLTITDMDKLNGSVISLNKNFKAHDSWGNNYISTKHCLIISF